MPRFPEKKTELILVISATSEDGHNNPSPDTAKQTIISFIAQDFSKNSLYKVNNKP
jgi:hypothetical protein